MYAAHTLPQDSPTPVCASNPFLFNNFYTPCIQWRLATPFPSTTSAHFPMQRRWEPLLNLSPAVGHSSLATVPKSFICHTSAKSAANSFLCHTSKNPLPQVLCLPHLRYPPTLDCSPAASIPLWWLRAHIFLLSSPRPG